MRESSASVVLAEQEAPDASTRPRREIYVELLVTVGLFAIPLVLSAYASMGQERIRGGWMFAGQAVHESLFIGLFFYVLRVNRERLGDFTRPLVWSDVPRTLGLLFVCLLLYDVVMLVLWKCTPSGWHVDLYTSPATAAFRGPLTPPFFALLLVNPFCEELWMRGFLQTRLGQLGWPTGLIVLTSAFVQAAYHVYQGVLLVLGYAVVFSVLGAYYQRTRRLWPVVGVHLVVDVCAGFVYSLR